MSNWTKVKYKVTQIYSINFNSTDTSLLNIQIGFIFVNNVSINMQFLELPWNGNITEYRLGNVILIDSITALRDVIFYPWSNCIATKNLNLVKGNSIKRSVS